VQNLTAAVALLSLWHSFARLALDRCVLEEDPEGEQVGGHAASSSVMTAHAAGVEQRDGVTWRRTVRTVTRSGVHEARSTSSTVVRSGSTAKLFVALRGTVMNNQVQVVCMNLLLDREVVAR
jgi:hypothetical protein